MAKDVRKGSELHNVSETWDQNERKRQSGQAPGREDTSTQRGDLEQVVREEAAEYDRNPKENRILGGERASVDDEPAGNTPEE